MFNLTQFLPTCKISKSHLAKTKMQIKIIPTAQNFLLGIKGVSNGPCKHLQVGKHLFYFASMSSDQICLASSEHSNPFLI